MDSDKSYSDIIKDMDEEIDALRRTIKAKEEEIKRLLSKIVEIEKSESYHRGVAHGCMAKVTSDPEESYGE